MLARCALALRPPRSLGLGNSLRPIISAPSNFVASALSPLADANRPSSAVRKACSDVASDHRLSRAAHTKLDRLARSTRDLLNRLGAVANFRAEGLKPQLASGSTTAQLIPIHCLQIGVGLSRPLGLHASLISSINACCFATMSTLPHFSPSLLNLLNRLNRSIS